MSSNPSSSAKGAPKSPGLDGHQPKSRLLQVSVKDFRRNPAATYVDVTNAIARGDVRLNRGILNELAALVGLDSTNRAVRSTLEIVASGAAQSLNFARLGELGVNEVVKQVAYGMPTVGVASKPPTVPASTANVLRILNGECA